jgi:serine phosphatase RsbU (regulator of sigma subunit)
MCATMACAIVDHGAAAVTHASAGHPPILVVDDHGATWLPTPQGPPLAVGSAVRTDTVTALGRTASLVLYSDGLVERRGDSIDVGLARLRDAALALTGQPAQAFADGLLERVVGADRSDDIVLVVHHLDGVAVDAAPVAA